MVYQSTTNHDSGELYVEKRKLLLLVLEQEKHSHLRGKRSTRGIKRQLSGLSVILNIT